VSQLTVIPGTQKQNNFKPKCSIQLDDKKETYTDFVAVCYSNETGKTTLLQNTDAVTLGQAARMLAQAFIDSYEALSISEKLLVDSILKA
jgi:hypothetical protein